MNRAKSWCYLALVVVLSQGCPGRKPAGGPSGPPAMGGPSTLSADAADEKGLTFRLSEGVARPDPGPKAPPAQATLLSEADTKKIYQRMPPIAAEADDAQDFALRDRSLPPPRTGKKVKTPFPPPAAPETAQKPPTGPLEVLRAAPEGDVPLAPQLSVTFNQPMVPVTSHDDLATARPVKLTPEPAGQWRWIGAKTLLFEPTGRRFPMATTYTVEIPAGTKSETGGALGQAKTFTFQTPPPTLMTAYPWDGPHGLDPVMVVAFDQKVDPQAVLDTLSILASGSRSFTARLATADEVAADAVASRLVEQLRGQGQEGRYFAFKAEGKLPVDAGVSVRIGPGTPSAEGPRRTTASQGFDFYTYGPLQIAEAACNWNEDCHPFDPWMIRFTNPIDAKKFDDAMVKVEPPIPGVKIELYDAYLYVRGRSKGRTQYTVTLDPAITDVFGQTLTGDRDVVFDVRSAPPTLFANGGELVVLDPAVGPRFSVYSTNHKKLKVQIYAVGPEHWGSYAAYMRDWYQDRRRLKLPGKKVVDTVIDVAGDPDELTETKIDLTAATRNGFGQAIVVVEPTVQPKRRWEWQVVHAWTQSTKLGLSAFVDAKEMIAWATDLATGKPLSGVEVAVAVQGMAGKTDAAGVAKLPLRPAKGKGQALLVAKKGDDLAILPERIDWWSDWSGWEPSDQGDVLRWFVFDDRGMYRPGEEVHVKGWLRVYQTAEGGDLQGLGRRAGGDKLQWRLQDSQGNEIAKGATPINAMGGFDLATKLPPTVNLGYTTLELFAPGGDHHHYLQVQEFRRPEFEVATEASEGPHLIGGHADVTVQASYYAGGGLPDAPAYWTVSTQPGSFTPPNRDDFTFGTWVPWWGTYDGYGSGSSNLYKSESYEARTDSSGAHHLRIDFESVSPPRAMVVSAAASVSDVNRQAWGSAATILVHPAAHYVGLRGERLFVNEGEPLHVDGIVTDLDGKAIAGRAVAMRAVRIDWTIEDGTWKTVEEKPEDCRVQSTEAPARCTFHPAEGGTYKVRAVIEDPQGRRNQSEITLWVAGGEAPPAREVAQQQVTLVPDQKEYRPDDVARILVQAPFAPSEGLVTIRRSGIVKTERITLKGTSTTIEVPITSRHVPNLYVQVDLVGAAVRTNDVGEPDPKLPKRPAYASGVLNLSVPPHERKLTVKVTPRAEKIEPGAETAVDVELRDAAGRPVAGGELAVVIVDESILALSRYQTPDPLAVFYAQREAGGRDHQGRAFVLLANPDDVAVGIGSVGTIGGTSDDDSGAGTGSGYGRGGGGGAPKRAAQPSAPPPPASAAPAEEAQEPAADGQPADPSIAVRANFDALALFAGAVPTGSDGRAEVKVKIPDNLTRYRVMVAAVAGGQQFGSGESAITARLPLMVRPSPPRFLNFGDQFELPVVVQNQTDAPLEVDVAARATNAQMIDGLGRRVTVPANDRVEVRFPAATVRAGVARFQVGAVAGTFTDAAEVKLPVWTPATSEAFATYGEIDKGAIVQPVKAPGDVFPQFGGVEVSTSSTALAALTDAVLYLVSYPFECSEQLSSRIMAVAALKDVLGAFQAEGLPPPAELIAAVDRDVERLRQLQNWDGGFPFWRMGEESWPWISIHGAHALQRAKEKGFRVPEESLQRSLAYLREIEYYIPGWYPPDVRRTIVAYALYVRHRMGDHDGKKARAIIAEAGGADKLSLEADGWLLATLTGDADATAELEAIRRHLNNRVSEEAGTAHFTTSYGDGAWLLLHSDRRADGIVLEALIADQPQSDLIPKVVRGLLAHRVAGRWSSTQENSFVLLALDRYFAKYENVTPDFVARVWLGGQYAGEHEFKGRTTEEHHVEVPMKWLAEKKGTQDLILEKKGDGRLYFRIGMRYAPKSLQLQASDHGFVVQRRYEAVEDPADVRREADGTWHVKAGKQVRVRLTMVAPSRRYHVALVDPIPAGLEPMNPALAVTGTIPKDPQAQQQGGWWWTSTWYEHQNLRDERVEAFTTLLWEGVWDYTYVARATTPGTFIVPPTKAEEMYHPETFGRSASDKLIVEP